MKYVLMVHHREPELEKLSPEEIQRVVSAHDAFSKELEQTGVKVDRGFRLRPGAEMVRLTQPSGPRGRRAIFDGPHVETKEVVGGFYVIDCATREEAMRWAERCPMWDSDVLELRPIWE
jgi:hypothetical protein